MTPNWKQSWALHHQMTKWNSAKFNWGAICRENGCFCTFCRKVSWFGPRSLGVSDPLKDPRTLYVVLVSNWCVDSAMKVYWTYVSCGGNRVSAEKKNYLWRRKNHAGVYESDNENKTIARLLGWNLTSLGPNITPRVLPWSDPDQANLMAAVLNVSSILTR